MVALMVVLALLLVWWAARRRKRANGRDDLTTAIGAATPRPWGGPRRWNGAPALRMPHKAMKGKR